MPECSNHVCPLRLQGWYHPRSVLLCTCRELAAKLPNVSIALLVWWSVPFQTLPGFLGLPNVSIALLLWYIVPFKHDQGLGCLVLPIMLIALLLRCVPFQTRPGLQGGGMQRVAAGKIKVCVQQPGEIIHVPQWHLHATTNLGDAVGIGEQALGHRTVGITPSMVSESPMVRQLHQLLISDLVGAQQREPRRPLPQPTATDAGGSSGGKSSDSSSQQPSAAARAADALRVLGTLFQGHTSTALTTATMLQRIAAHEQHPHPSGSVDPSKGEANDGAGGGEGSNSGTAPQELMGQALSVVLDAFHRLQVGAAALILHRLYVLSVTGRIGIITVCTLFLFHACT